MLNQLSLNSIITRRHLPICFHSSPDQQSSTPQSTSNALICFLTSSKLLKKIMLMMQDLSTETPSPRTAVRQPHFTSRHDCPGTAY